MYMLPEGKHRCGESGIHDRDTCRCRCSFSFCVLWKRRAFVREHTKRAWDLLIESHKEMNIEYREGLSCKDDEDLKDFVDIFTAWFERMDDP